MKTIKKQFGVGMVEVLVALVLLALGVLGFTALQLRAVEAGEEALLRSQSTLLLRGLTESIRVNPQGQSFYPAKVQAYAGITSEPNAAKPSCLDVNCTAEQMAAFDAFLVAKSAFNTGINITMATCPGVKSNRQCLFAAWGGTKLSAANYSSCVNTDGKYVNNAKCLMMEAY